MIKKPRHPDRQTTRYSAGLVLLLKPVWRAVKNEVLPILQPDFKVDTADFKTISKVFNKIRLALFQQMLPSATLAAWKAARQVDGHAKDEYKRVLKVDPFKTEPWLKPLSEDWVAENVSLVRSVAERHLGKLEKTVYSMVREGKGIKEIRSELKNIFDLGDNAARLLARDQINKFNGQLSEERQTRLGVTKYIWRTSDDQRVRPEHEKLDDEVFEWANPPITNKKGERNHPGGDILCRCWAEPVLKGLI